MTETETFRLLTMRYCNICQLSKCSAVRKLTKHENLQVVPMRHRPTFGFVVVLGEYSSELSLRKKLGYLRNDLIRVDLLNILISGGRSFKPSFTMHIL